MEDPRMELNALFAIGAIGSLIVWFLIVWRIWRWFERAILRILAPRRSRRRRRHNRKHVRREFTPQQRVQIRAKLRDRDGDDCQICGLPLASLDEPWHIDHIEPQSLGGSDDLRNLRLTHESCNMERGNRVD